MSGPNDLPDVNVWLALGVADHPHHARAQRYWYEQSGEEVAFCWVTVLGFLRLCTHPKVMAGEPLTVSRAWEGYLAFRRLPEVALANEPEGCEKLFGDWASGDQARPRLWTDAYLASFARAGGFRLITFDRDFSRFRGLDLLRLED